MGVGGPRHAPAALLSGSRPRTHFTLHKGGPVWTGTENVAPIGFRFPDRPPHSELLYRLRYSGH